MADAEKRYGKSLPETIDPPARVCFVMEMPDTLEYRAAVMGQINWLADWRCWEHTQADYVNPPARNLAAAALWAEANTRAFFQECPVDCEKIIECIETDADVQQAFNEWFLNQLSTNTAIQQALSQQFSPPVPGEEVPPWYLQKNAAANNPDCDLDKAWGNIRHGLVDRSFQRVMDVLEKIELTTDNQEMLASALNSMPVLGAAFDVIPITDAFLWFDNVRNWMKEAFEAGDTIELRDQIACDLFCMYQEDCTLSIQSIRDYYWDKATELIPLWENAFQNLGTIFEALAQSTVSFGDAIVYALVGSQYGFMTFINDWFGIQMDCIFGDMKLGDPSDDWMALCPDCPTTWERIYNFTVNEDGWVPVVSGQAQAVYVPGNGFEHGESPSRVGRITLQLDVGFNINVESVEVKLTSATISGDTQTVSVYRNPLYTLVEGQPYSDDVTFTTNFTANQVVIDVVAGGDPSTDPIPGYLVEIKMIGTGTPPP